MFDHEREEIVIDRTQWELSREYRKAPFKKRYEELKKFEESLPADLFNHEIE